ncbi:hypothetical protein CAAN1_27S01200 [[Candida] anglica]|uniref:EamA domain-containing protein n=1 Tax=[Candida] anglica TaxID=148631 RepID=A0ABP0E7S6_9ASCO
MAITVLPSDSNGLVGSEGAAHSAASSKKIAAIVVLFLLSLLSFVCQTEFTSSAYKLGFKEPVFLLFVTHGSWWIFWPCQALVVSILRTHDKYQRDKKSPRSALSPINSARYHRLDSQSQLLEEQQLFEESGQAQGLASTGSVVTGAPITRSSASTQAFFYWSYFKKCIIKQIHNVYHTAILVYEANVNHDTRTERLNELVEQNPRLSSLSVKECVRSLLPTQAFQYILKRCLYITAVLTVAGLTWYAAMSMTYPSDVTAIYNCSAFTAYAFAIPLLGEKFSWLKASSVIIAVAGVFTVAYSPGGEIESSEGSESVGELVKRTLSVAVTMVTRGSDDESSDEYPLRSIGNLIILVGAVLYGYYEVIYKKYTCIGPHIDKTITPRRQVTFANFIMGLLGLFTGLIMGSVILLCQIIGIHHFKLFSYGDDTVTIWLYILGSIISNLTFSASFLSLMSLTNPVLSSVSSLLTIFLIGVVEWVMYGVTLSAQQLAGDFLVVVGFAVLTIASWKEISEGKDDDDVEAISTYSFAISTDG